MKRKEIFDRQSQTRGQFDDFSHSIEKKERSINFEPRGVTNAVKTSSQGRSSIRAVESFTDGALVGRQHNLVDPEKYPSLKKLLDLDSNDEESQNDAGVLDLNRSEFFHHNLWNNPTKNQKNGIRDIEEYLPGSTDSDTLSTSFSVDIESSYYCSPFHELNDETSLSPYSPSRSCSVGSPSRPEEVGEVVHSPILIEHMDLSSSERSPEVRDEQLKGQGQGQGKCSGRLAMLV